MATNRCIIIGAGPAGLVSCKTLLHFPRSQSNSTANADAQDHRGEPAFDPIVLEQQPELGGTFHYRSYENGHLVSSKQLTAFSDYRFPIDAPDHVTLPQYVDYLTRYCQTWGITAPLSKSSSQTWQDTPFHKAQSRVQYGWKVTRVNKASDGKGHIVTAEAPDGESHDIFCNYLLVCTGLHVTPAVPDIKGVPENLVPQQDAALADPATSSGIPQTPPVPDWPKSKQSPGVRVIHSSQYKRRQEFKDRRVLILGIGETSMDLSYEAIQGGAKEVVVCHRGGFLSFPKVLNDFQVFGVKFDGDLPIDGLITNLFETAYVHRWVAALRLRWKISDLVIKRVLWFLTGTQEGCNQWVGGLPPERLGRAYVFLNKSSRAMPYINAPYQPAHQSRFLARVLGTRYIDPPLPKTTCSVIDLALWPDRVDETGRVHFKTSAEIPQSGGIRRIEEERMRDREVRPDLVVYATGYRQDWDWLGPGYDKGPGQVDVREITSSRDLSLGYIGFVRPGVGAIPPIAEMQVMLWALMVTGRAQVPTGTPHYRLLASKTARIQYGVDHSAYMSTLAKDMGGQPGLWELYRDYGVKTMLCYAFGAAFGPFYRLTGPLRGDHDEMQRIVNGEIWETITRRGIAGNLFMGVIPMLFYALVNLGFYLLELVWLASGQPFKGYLGEDALAQHVDKPKKVQ